MTHTQTTLSAFEQTTVDAQQVRAYLLTAPNYYGAGLDYGASKDALDNLYFADLFEFHFKRYLTGHPKTLHRVFAEVRDFMQHDTATARRMVAFSMDSVQDTILRAEWYELMSRYQYGRKQIERRFEIIPTNDFARLTQ